MIEIIAKVSAAVENSAADKISFYPNPNLSRSPSHDIRCYVQPLRGRVGIRGDLRVSKIFVNQHTAWLSAGTISHELIIIPFV